MPYGSLLKRLSYYFFLNGTSTSTSDFDNRISALKIEHEDKIKSLEAKIATFEKVE